MTEVSSTPFLEYYPAGRPIHFIRLVPLPFVIGRSPSSEFAVGSHQVSKRHAEISNLNQEFQIRDLNSTNGTAINGQLITQATALKNNDIIQITHEEFRFVASSEDCSERPSSLLVTKPTNGKVPTSLFLGKEYLREMLVGKRVRVLFQRIVDLASGDTIGHEALSRGAHSQLSMMPAELLGLADRCGLAPSLSAMFRQAAIANGAALPLGEDLFLNLHPTEMGHPDLIESLRNIQLAGASRQLVVEINENAVADLPIWHKLYQQLRILGIRIAYDDFGMGQARFLELAELPPDFIKLDMQLVRNIHRSPARQDLVQALTQASTKLGVRIIAEGIESEEEAETCRHLGCQFGQGYYLGLPRSLALAAPQESC
jgi:EAL domain-containing protein (putative c-di-GMP-specific phosphodiesterase class I)